MRVTDIQPVAAFIAKKIVLLRKTIVTSTDLDEKVDALAQVVMCESSINLLILAYLTEDASFIDSAKDIYRGI